MEKVFIILFVVGFLGLGALIAGGVLFPFLPKLFHHKIEQNVPLINGSDSYQNWLEPSAPVFMQFWVFHVVNPDDIVKNKSKPIVEERGPYTYREVRQKIDVRFSGNDTQISYRERKSYVFERNMSVGPEDDNFTSVNLPILTAADLLKNHPIVSKLVQEILQHYDEHLFDNFTVGGYLWGYEEKTLAAINKILTKFHLPGFPDDKFGLFYGKSGNGTDDGVYVINTGSDDVKKINVIDTWRSEPNLSFWKTKYCNMINGTDATIFHPFVDKGETLYIFSSDICRSIYIKYKEEYKLKGIDLYRFSPPTDVFANYTENPDNEGFCIPDKSGCLGSGVLNISPCKSNAPIILSQPHFYQGAKEFIDAIIGINPSEEYATDIDIEPNTGVAMNLAKKLQINAMISKLSALPETQNMKKTIFPIIWLNESAVIQDDDANTFRNKVLKPMKIMNVVKIALIAVGGTVLLICIALAIAFVVKRKKDDDDVALLNPGSVSGDE